MERAECKHERVRYLDCETCPPGTCAIIICCECGDEPEGTRHTYRLPWYSMLWWRIRLWWAGL